MNLKEISIFKNLSDEEIKELTSETEIIEKSYDKDAYVFRVGDRSGDLFFLREGALSVYQIDSNGKRYIFQKFDKPVLFGEVYAYLNEPFDFDAVCDKDSRILIIKDFKGLFDRSDNQKFLKSYISFLSNKCMALSKKNQITSQMSLRQKITKYFLEIEEDGKINLNMNRQALADFLTTTRPSLSRELSKMADDGLIEIKGSKIAINKEKLAEIL